MSIIIGEVFMKNLVTVELVDRSHFDFNITELVKEQKIVRRVQSAVIFLFLNKTGCLALLAQWLSYLCSPVLEYKFLKETELAHKSW